MGSELADPETTKEVALQMAKLLAKREQRKILHQIRHTFLVDRFSSGTTKRTIGSPHAGHRSSPTTFSSRICVHTVQHCSSLPLPRRPQLPAASLSFSIDAGGMESICSFPSLWSMMQRGADLLFPLTGSIKEIREIQSSLEHLVDQEKTIQSMDYLARCKLVKRLAVIYSCALVGYSTQEKRAVSEHEILWQKSELYCQEMITSKYLILALSLRSLFMVIVSKDNPDMLSEEMKTSEIKRITSVMQSLVSSRKRNDNLPLKTIFFYTSYRFVSSCRLSNEDVDLRVLLLCWMKMLECNLFIKGKMPLSIADVSQSLETHTVDLLTIVDLSPDSISNLLSVDFVLLFINDALAKGEAELEVLKIYLFAVLSSLETHVIALTKERSQSLSNHDVFGSEPPPSNLSALRVIFTKKIYHTRRLLFLISGLRTQMEKEERLGLLEFECIHRNMLLYKDYIWLLF